jgi:porin
LSVAAVLLALAASPAAQADDDGYAVSAVYTGEAWRNLRGGVETGSRYLDNLDLSLEIDGGRAWGVAGLALYGSLLYNNGHSISELTGDTHGTSNIEAIEQVRLYELWADWTLGAGRRRSLRLGLYDVNSEFDVTPSAGLFVHPAHGIGTDISQSGELGPSIFPYTSLALRFAARSAAGWVAQLAVLDGVPADPRDPRRTTIRFDSNDGALLLAEVHRTGQRLLKSGVGIWGYTADFDDVVETDESGAPLSRSGNSGAYALLDVLLAGESLEAGGALTGFLRIGVAERDVNRFDRYLGAGLVLHGALLPSRGDQLGLAVAIGRNGEPFRRSLRLQELVAAEFETNVELTWRVPIDDRLVLQPTLQYADSSPLDGAVEDAIVFALRFELAPFAASSRE